MWWPGRRRITMRNAVPHNKQDTSPCWLAGVGCVTASCSIEWVKWVSSLPTARSEAKLARGVLFDAVVFAIATLRRLHKLAILRLYACVIELSAVIEIHGIKAAPVGDDVALVQRPSNFAQECGSPLLLVAPTLWVLYICHIIAFAANR